ncbi:MAG TPA: diguanylate cyclase [Gemmatimonadales bacterium]|nr:diguanylate cyclase [Gemmatimonadales bacterium]
MRPWQETIAGPLRALHLNTLVSRLLALAVVATLIPTLAILSSYRHEQPSLSDTVAQELRSASSEAARQADVWLDERLSELRVAAGSFVLSENLARVGGQALARLRDYLNSVRERCTGCEALLVADVRGRTGATSVGRTGGMQLPLERLNGLRTGDAFVGDVYWDAGVGKPAVVLAVPVREADGRFVGALVAKVNLRYVGDMLQRLAADDPKSVYLMTDEGKLVIGPRGSSAELMRTRVPRVMVQTLLDKEGQVVEYKRGDGQDVVGTLRRAPQLRVAAVAELPRSAAIRPGGQPRHGAGLILTALFAGVAVMAGGMSLLVVGPLGRITRAATKVAAGDLSVELPTSAGGELGDLMRVFNNMVVRLREREAQGELERLSVTDGLTGLYNRRHLMGTLSNEVQRSRRLRRTFSVLLADVDHFKQYNDAHGHLAGDAVLVKVAEIFRKMTRAVDSVARYGGEEFVVMLIEAPVTVAATVAERIRARVAAEQFEGGRMSVSIGAAEYPAHGDTPEELIASADAAMYRAKSDGRDRVMVAVGGPVPDQEKKGRRKADR